MTAEFEPWDDSLEEYLDMDEEVEDLKDYIEVLEAYIDYVKNCLSEEELPFTFEEWLELEEEDLVS